MKLPKTIADRVELITVDQIVSVKHIKPAKPCECGKHLDEIRRVRIQRNTEPVPHVREYCYVCKLVSIRGENTWKTAVELNQEMRATHKPPKINPVLTEDDK